MAIVLTKEVADHMLGYDLSNQRLIMVQIQTTDDPLFIYQAYAPDSSYSEEDREEFYDMLQQHINILQRKSKMILLGDFNAKVGKDSYQNWSEVVGKFTIGNSNENGDKLLQFCGINSLALMNTMYKHPKQRLVTWTSPDGKTQNQIDFIIVPNKQKGLIKNCRVFNSADINSDHSLLMAKYMINYKKKKHYARAPKRYDVTRLYNEEIAKDFEIKIGGAYQPLLELDASLEDMYKQYIDTTNKITEDVVGTKKHKAVLNMSEDTAALCEERRCARRAVRVSPEDPIQRQIYKTLNRQVKAAVKAEKADILERKIKQLEEDFKNNNSHNVFKTVRELEEKPRKSLCVVKDKDGNKKVHMEEVLEIWQNHFKTHLNTAFPHNPNTLNEIAAPPHENIDDGLYITKEDIRKAIKSLKRRKAPGSDAITAEVLKAGGETMVSMLDKIFLKVIEEEDIPMEWAKMLVTPIHKKGDKHNHANYRAIALLSIPGKVFNKVILQKIREKTETYSSQSQFGFRPNRGTVDAIFIVRQLMQKAKERGVDIHFHFIDFKSAFDTVWRKALWKMMRAIGVNSRIVNIIEKMYDKTNCAVVIDGHITEWFHVSVGVRQGCLLSPTLFNLFLDFVMEEIKCLQNHITMDENLAMDLRYADDTTLISTVFTIMNLSTEQLEEACRQYGLKINADKCRIISSDLRDIQVEGKTVKKVEEFVFLGSLVPSTNADIRRMISLASIAFGKLRNSIWSRRNINRKLKLRLYKSLIIPIAIYGSEIWAMTKEDCRILQVFENNCLRSILGVTLRDKMSIDKIHRMAGIENNICNTIRKRRLTWFGHVCRRSDDSLVKQIFKEDFRKKRGRGRPPKRWSDLIKEDTGLPLATAEKYARDRENWRRKVNTKWAKPYPGYAVK